MNIPPTTLPQHSPLKPAAAQGGNNGAPGETTRILSGEQLTPDDAVPEGEEVLTASAAEVLQIIEDYVFVRGTSSTGERVTSGSRTAGFEEVERPSLGSLPVPTDADSTNPCYSFSQAIAAPASAILARASVLAEAVCVWGRFGLSVGPLEAALRPRLTDEADNARVLTALFFPQLSPDTCESVGMGGRGDPTPQRAHGVDRQSVWKARADGQGWDTPCPSRTQIDAARTLGLSPRFHLALMQAGRTVAAASGSCGRPRDVGSRVKSSRPFGYASSPRTSSGYERQPALPSPFSVLVEHRAQRDGVSSVWTAGCSVATTGDTEGSVGGPRVDSSHNSVSAEETHGRKIGAASDSEVVWFSCGHRYSRDHLLHTVVPACVSSLGHATSSLQRTQQILVREYEGRNTSAACPECAVKELKRLVSGLRPAATDTVAVAAVSSRRMMSPPRSLRSTLLQAHERTTAR